jgi:Abortive infection alpha
VWGFEKVEEWIAEAVAPNINRIPEENRVEPALIIAGPAIDSMKYCGSEPYLRDFFANLLAAAMDSRTTDAAHPAFVEMIKLAQQCAFGAGGV